MLDLCELNDLSNLIDKPVCYKNFDKPTCIELTLTNKSSYFQHKNVFETGLFDIHLLKVKEFKMEFQKLRHQKAYCSYKNFDNHKFQADTKTYRFYKNDVNSF